MNNSRLNLNFKNQNNIISDNLCFYFVFQEKGFFIEISTTYESFSSTILSDKRSSNLDSGNIKLTYNSVSHYRSVVFVNKSSKKIILFVFPPYEGYISLSCASHTLINSHLLFTSFFFQFYLFYVTMILIFFHRLPG